MADFRRTYRRGSTQRVYSPDMLSQLPEEIQSQVLSFLPTADAAKAGFCSKFLWTAWHSIPKLIFDYNQFPVMEGKMDNFIKFIDETLERHDDSEVKRFEVFLLPIMGRCRPIKNKWIAFAVAHNVQKLVLYGKLARGQQLPDYIFWCHSLVKLELALEKLLLELPENVELPNLRKLKLKFLKLFYPQVRRDLLSCFPSLEKLSIMFCYIRNFRGGLIEISSSKLREFVFCLCPGMENCSIRFVTPCLSKFIYICGSIRNRKLILPKYSLGIVIKVGGVYFKSATASDMDRCLVKLTRELLKAYHLRLSHWLIEYLCMIHDLPKQMASFDDYYYLNVLDIEIWPFLDHFAAVILLVSKCPNLRTLSLEFGAPQRQPGYLSYLDEDIENYDFQGGFHTINHVNIDLFIGDEEELMLVKIFLAHTSNLSEMKFRISMFMKDGAKDVILGFEKASASANIIFD